MADQANNNQALTIPEETGKRFPKLVEMVQKSSSMNQEERQYWIDVLPIMTDDQIKNLDEILTNEQKQLARAEEDYSKQVNEKTAPIAKKFDVTKVKEKKRILTAAEKKSEKQEQKEEENILKKLEEI
jgi:hypothetical protein